MKYPELVIFDCDGVLIDDEGMARRCFQEGLSDCGVRVSGEELERYLGASSIIAKADIEARYQLKLPEDFIEKNRVRFRRYFKEEVKSMAMSGIFELIDALPLKKCVASGSSLEGLRYSLGLTGLWERFAPHIFSAEQVKNGKPEPDLFLFAAEQMGVAPADCLVIEDSVAGVRAAKAANMRVFGFTGGSHCRAGHAETLLREGAEQVFGNMNQIAEVLLQSTQAERILV